MQLNYPKENISYTLLYYSLILLQHFTGLVNNIIN